MEPVTTQITIGIDVSKTTLDVATSAAPTVITVPNNAKGFARLIAMMRSDENPLIVLEATGEYHIPMVEALEAAGYLAAICNPARVRHFAKGMGWDAKTDKVDARLLVAFGQARKPTCHPLLPPILRKLKALLARRDDLVSMRTMEINRASATHDAGTRASTQRMQAVLTAEIKQLNQAIADLIASDPALAQRMKQLSTAPGIGDTTGAELLVSLAELGTLPPPQLAALVGVAPFARDSGSYRGKRFIKGGRENTRKALYQSVTAAVFSTKRDNVLKTFYQSLRQRGKPHNLAMVATMRHLLRYLNVMVRDNLIWDELNVNKPPLAA